MRPLAQGETTCDSLKILALLTVAAAAMMAFAASASADTLTTTTGGVTDTTPTVHAVAENSHAILHNPEANIECASTFNFTVTKHEAGKRVRGHITNLSFGPCTNGWTVTVNAPGTLTVEALGENRGTVTSHGATVTASFFFGLVTCCYVTENTSIGTVTGGNPATLHIEGKIPFHGGSEACGTEPSQWTGDYVTTTALHFDKT